MREIELILDGVAGELSWLDVEPVFVGGATIGLFLDAFGRAQLRPTFDIDCIVPQVLTAAAWWTLEERLRRHGWSPDPDGPICRYRSPSGARVDLMSENPGILGFSGRWYPSTVETAERRSLVTGREVRVPTPGHLLACKLEAWDDRGRKDPLLSKDLEDIVALVDGCAELEARVLGQSAALRSYVARGLEQILANPLHREVAIGQLPRGGDTLARQARLLATMAHLAVCAGAGSDP